eukprot:1160449-Pelagomonas_calceolata.AAC.6
METMGFLFILCHDCADCADCAILVEGLVEEGAASVLLHAKPTTACRCHSLQKCFQFVPVWKKFLPAGDQLARPLLGRNEDVSPEAPEGRQQLRIAATGLPEYMRLKGSLFLKVCRLVNTGQVCTCRSCALPAHAMLISPLLSNRAD